MCIVYVIDSLCRDGTYMSISLNIHVHVHVHVCSGSELPNAVVISHILSLMHTCMYATCTYICTCTCVYIHVCGMIVVVCSPGLHCTENLQLSWGARYPTSPSPGGPTFVGGRAKGEPEGRTRRNVPSSILLIPDSPRVHVRGESPTFNNLAACRELMYVRTI